MSYGQSSPPPPPGGGYGYGGGGYGGQPVEHPRGTTILVLGILSIVCCSPLGPVAVVMGNNAKKEIASSGQPYSNSGLIQAGWICGIIGCVSLVLGLLYVILVVAIGIGASS